MKNRSHVLLLAAFALAPLSTSVAYALEWPDGAARAELDMASTDPARRREAVRRAAHGSKAIGAPLIRKALTDADSDVRVQAADAASVLRLRDVEDLLYPWFGEREAQVKMAAAHYFKALPSPRATAHLARALSDTDVLVRTAAAEALAVHPPAEAVPALVAKLDDASIQVRVEVVRALGQMGDPRGTLPLVGKVQDSAPEVRVQVAHALSELSDARAYPALLVMLRDVSVEVRIEALRAIGLLKVPSAESAVAALFADRNPAVREAVLKTLAALQTKAAVRLLVTRLGSSDDSGNSLEATPVRTALASAGAETAPIVAALVERADGSARSTSAAWVLGALNAKAFAPQVTTALRRGGISPEVALSALGRMKAQSALPVVLEYLTDSSSRVRDEARKAAKALLEPTAHDGRAVDPISLALADVRFDVAERSELLELLGLTGSPRATPLLAQFVQAKDNALRLASVRALGHVGGAAADDVLGKLVVVEDNATQVAAIEALAESGGPGALTVLLRTLGGDHEIDRGAALAALGAVASRYPEDRVVTAVEAMLGNAAGAERDALLEVLARMRSKLAEASLTRLVASGSELDRRSIAALLANFPGARASLLRLAKDDDEVIRANAAWSLGSVGRAEDIPTLLALTKDLSGVAPNAVASASAIVVAQKLDARAAEIFCPFVTDARGDVQNNALIALARSQARCGSGDEIREVLARAPSARLRRAAAHALAASITPTAADDANRRALARCAAVDRVSDVAAACRNASAPPEAKTAPNAEPQKFEHVTVYVVGDASARNSRSVALVLPDGMVRWSRTDRRGAVVEPRVIPGELRLVEPSWR